MSNYCTAIFSYRDMKQSSLPSMYTITQHDTFPFSNAVSCDLGLCVLMHLDIQFFCFIWQSRRLVSTIQVQCAFVWRFLWYLLGFNSNPDVWMHYICTFLNVGDESKVLCFLCMLGAMCGQCSTL